MITLVNKKMSDTDLLPNVIEVKLCISRSFILVGISRNTKAKVTNLDNLLHYRSTEVYTDVSDPRGQNVNFGI